MDVHSNAAVSSNLVEDFLPCDNMEGGGVSLEWLSNFVEECLNGQGFTTQLPLSTTPIPTATTSHQASKPTQLPQKDLSMSTTTSIPSKARTKRRRSNNSQVMNVNMNANSPDPTLLPQAYWLADSELLNFPKKQQQQQQDEEEPRQVKLKVKLEEEEEEGEGEEGKVVQPRRCTHCGSYKTPQWRAGPLGPKTLCNACGVRFKSGRLLPEYRPAKSPTFESFKHSNSHKKVMEMRMATPLSSHSNSSFN